MAKSFSYNATKIAPPVTNRTTIKIFNNFLCRNLAPFRSECVFGSTPNKEPHIAGVATKQYPPVLLLVTLPNWQRHIMVATCVQVLILESLFQIFRKTLLFRTEMGIRCFDFESSTLSVPYTVPYI